MSGSNLLVNAAQSYAKQGWQVFPLHTPTDYGCSCGTDDCSNPGKHPRTAHGLLDATTDKPQIGEWWRTWPDANIGIRTGQESGILVVDLDGEDGCQGFAELSASYGGPINTFAVKTGNGRHLYFEHPAVAIKNSTRKLGKGIDIRAGRGYVVAAPSLHANGKCYEIEDPGQRLTLPPEWLVSEMTKNDVKNKQERDTRDMEDNAFTEAPAVTEGSRNDTLHKLGSALRGQQGMEQEQIENILLEYNKAKCDPPLAESEVLRIASSICRYPAELQKKRSGKRAEENPLYWFKFNLRDFFGDQNVMLMTDYQTGWYVRLKALAWQNGGFLPADKSKLQRLAKARSRKAFERDCDLVLDEYELVIHNGVEMLRNRRMAEQYAEILDGWLQKKEAGEASRTARLLARKSSLPGANQILQ